jgi:SAM-dependent methyltransferase
MRIVDFAAGTGHFGLLVVATIPNTVVTLVDTDQRLLDIARDRAASLGPAVASRVTVCCCAAADYTDSFDLSLCLHGCGSLTDEAIAQAARHDAAFCCVPCCYSELEAPQSAVFAAQEWLDADTFQQLSRAAEHPGGEVGPGVPVEYVVDTPVSRRAMLALDSDRALALWEKHPRYVSKIARLSPLSCSPKHHVLVGWVDLKASQDLNSLKRFWMGSLQWSSWRRNTGLHPGNLAHRISFSPRRGLAAQVAEPIELVDGLPWLS